MAKSKKRVTRVAQESEETPAPAETRVRRDEEDRADERGLVSKVIIAVLILLGLFLLFNLFSNASDQENDDDASGGSSQVEESEDASDSEDGAENENDENSTEDNQSTGTTVQESDSEYTYTVGEGESYTTIARRAVTSFGGDLTPAERIAAETKLVADANAEWLNIGQKLVLTKDSVRSAVEWAKGLSSEEKAAWQPYADLVAW